MNMTDGKVIKIAIHALGGQGGGVLANWIAALGESAGFIVQSTSVPGVAQRTGATVYYVELFPEASAQAKGKPPVLALMPAPGDVDIVIAAELMEAGRAIMRGFVSKQTTLISSSHRVYAIGEKIHMGDGRQSDESILAAAHESAGRFVLSDMDALAASVGAVISVVLLGALAGSGVLPISRQKFENAIRSSGRAVPCNLAGFNAGFDAVSLTPDALPLFAAPAEGTPADAVKPLVEKLHGFPASAHSVMREGLKRAVDYQDIAYGSLYLERLHHIYKLDERYGGRQRDWMLLKTVARRLALWMAYEDIIRVADLKTRASRFQRCREDVKADDAQIVHLLEFMHPRIEEVCDILPTPVAKKILKSPGARGVFMRVMGEGRRVSTTKLRGFLMLNMLATLRFLRRRSFRYGVEQERISDWLHRIEKVAAQDYPLACEVADLPRLIKGYGETHVRGFGNYELILSSLDKIKMQANTAGALRRLCDAALKDEAGVTLEAEIKKPEQLGSAA
jgi:indolepyruvate ferredoxin oxidoreductase, beta subunit